MSAREWRKWTKQEEWSALACLKPGDTVMVLNPAPVNPKVVKRVLAQVAASTDIPNGKLVVKYNNEEYIYTKKDFEAYIKDSKKTVPKTL